MLTIALAVLGTVALLLLGAALGVAGLILWAALSWSRHG